MKALKTSAQSDPAMFGQLSYPRSKLDFYPTPRDPIISLLESGEIDTNDTFWEPACGDGAIVKMLVDHCLTVISTDIKYYGFEDGTSGVDFLGTIVEPGKIKPKLTTEFHWEEAFALEGKIQAINSAKTLSIITNPPYNKPYKGIGLDFLRKALEVTKESGGTVAFLLPHEWDAAKQSNEFVDAFPPFTTKLTLQYRPRWQPGSTGSPRHNYAWFIWNWKNAAPARPLYASRPEKIAA